MKYLSLVLISALSLTSAFAANKPAVIGGEMYPNEHELFLKTIKGPKEKNSLAIYAMGATPKSQLAMAPLFLVENITQHLDEDFNFDNPEMQIFVSGRVSRDARGDMVLKYKLYSGSRYLQFTGKTEDARRQNRMHSTEVEAQLLLLRKTPTILYQTRQNSTTIPLDISKAPSNDYNYFMVVATKL